MWRSTKYPNTIAALPEWFPDPSRYDTGCIFDADDEKYDETRKSDGARIPSIYE